MTQPPDDAPPAISEAEARVMQELWQREPQSAEELAQTLSPAQGWQMSTVKTLLNRLLQKGAVSAERDGRRFLYRPAFARDAWQAREGLSLIDRLFGGRLAPLVAQFASERRLSADDVTALREMLDQYQADAPRRAGPDGERR